MGLRLFDCSLIIGLLLAVIATVSKVAATTDAVQQPTSPSVRPVEHFDDAADAEKLTNLIMSGMRHEDVINKLLVERSGAQRESIIYTINRMYGNTVLFTVLLRFAAGNYGLAMSNVLSRPLFLYTNELRNAIVNRDESTILEILLSVDSKFISTMSKDYQSQFNATFVDDVNRIASSQVFKDIVYFLAYNRQETCVQVTSRVTRKMAADLVNILPETVTYNCIFKCGFGEKLEILLTGLRKLTMKLLEGAAATNATLFTAIFTDICYPLLKAVDWEYFLLTGQSLTTTLYDKFEATMGIYFDMIVQFVVNRPKYFALKLYNAIHHTGGPKVSDINRIIVARSEIDLNDIQKAYDHEFGSPLADDLATVTDGSHKKLLLAFLGHF